MFARRNTDFLDITVAQDQEDILLQYSKAQVLQCLNMETVGRMDMSGFLSMIRNLVVVPKEGTT